MRKLTEPWNNPDYDRRVEYRFMSSTFDRCWACYATRKPFNYFAPWFIERAHICNKPRREDRRLVVMLCSICHKANHNDILVGFERPHITAAMMIGLKQEHDSEWLDLEFVQKHSVRILPVGISLPSWYETQRQINKPSFNRKIK